MMNLFLITPWPFLATAAFIALLWIYALKQPHRPGTRYFYWILGFWWISTLAAVLTTIIQARELRYVLWVFQCVGVLLTSSMNLIFSLEYTGNSKWLNQRNLALIFLPALTFGLLSIILPSNYLITIHTHFGIELIKANEVIRWIIFGTASGIWIINAGVLGWSLMRAPAFSTPIGLMILGQAIPLITFAVVDPELITVAPIQLSILFSNFTCLAYFVALYNFRLLRVVPVAWDNAIYHMPYGIIVLDGENFLIGFNPAAQALPGLPGKLVLRQAAATALGKWWERILPLIGPERVSQEIVIQTNAGQQYFQVFSESLMHISGWRMGQVFVLEDITQGRQAQEMQVQKLWAQATLQEREQLAHELHDGLSQNLAFLNMQAQAAQIQILAGQSQAAQVSLVRLTEAASQIQELTREMIGNLLTMSMPADNFNVTLFQILRHFEQETGLEVHLDMDGNAIAKGLFAPTRLPPSVGPQLIRMTQEVLANVRKHALVASKVSVQLKASEERLILIIKDDGVGFDPAAQPNNGKQFGLQILRQRAARIGAQIAIDSAPGAGTSIEICAPLANSESKVMQ